MLGSAPKYKDKGKCVAKKQCVCRGRVQWTEKCYRGDIRVREGVWLH